MEDEHLVFLVKQYKELYDTNNRNYHNHLKRDNIWEEIGDKLGANGEDCRKRWTNLRDCHRKSIKKRKTKSEKGPATLKPWRLDQQMEFMRPFVQGRQKNLLKTISSNVQAGDNIDMDVESPDALDAIERDVQPPSSVSSGESSKWSRPINNSADILEDYLQYKLNKPSRGDHLTKYFEATEETVRTFPVLLQIEAKKKISDILYDLELKALELQHSSEESHQGDNIKYSPQESQSPTGLNCI